VIVPSPEPPVATNARSSPNTKEFAFVNVKALIWSIFVTVIVLGVVDAEKYEPSAAVVAVTWHVVPTAPGVRMFALTAHVEFCETV
jgi:hypothetical protein